MSTERARSLRKRMPPAEARMWNMLREEPFKGFHFRRQVALGPYYADFASHSAKLVIEIDGDTHGRDDAAGYDRRRDAFIRGQGYAVWRFTNDDVMENLTGVAELLLQRLGPPPTRPLRGHPPHKGEGDRWLDRGASSPAESAAPTSPSPLWGGDRGGGAP